MHYGLIILILSNNNPKSTSELAIVCYITVSNDVKHSEGTDFLICTIL